MGANPVLRREAARETNAINGKPAIALTERHFRHPGANHGHCTGAAQTAHAAPPEWAKGRILVAPKAGLSVRMSGNEWGRTNPPRCFQTTNYRNSAITGA